jgi:chromosome segregation ATPase
MNRTLEERERLAYITNAPEHALYVEMLDAESDAQDELRDERDEAEQAAKDANDTVEELEQDIEKAETDLATGTGKLEDAEIEIGDLQEKIQLAGVDLV